jgi:hypothetical protein
MASERGGRNRRYRHFAGAYQHLVNHGWQRRVNHGARSAHC